MIDVRRVFAATAFAAVVGATALQPVRADGALYTDLGGKPGITAVVGDFIGFVAADARINHFFAHANIPRLEGLLVDQICYASGGPCTYGGRSMSEAHKGMGIKDADFNALVEDLQKALDKHDVPITTQNRLLAVLAPLQSEVDYK